MLSCAALCASGMTSSYATRLIELGTCAHAPASATGGSSVGGAWDWTAEGTAAGCLTITDGTVKKTSERDGDYHLAHGPELSSGLHSWKIHVRELQLCIYPPAPAVTCYSQTHAQQDP